MRSFPVVCALVTTLTPSFAVNIPSGSAVGPPPVAVGTGLFGKIYDVAVNDLAGALNGSTGTPDATFIASSIDYPNGVDDIAVGALPMDDFLGSDAATLVGNPPTSFGAVFVLSGFIAIDRAETVGFAVGSDDGFRLTIGGVVVSEFSAERSFSFSFGEATFEEDGLYPIDLVYFANDQGESGIEFFSTIPGGRVIDNPAGDYSLVPTNVLYVPEASPTVLLGVVGALVVAGRFVRRRLGSATL
jgi:hypothetical protein